MSTFPFSEKVLLQGGPMDGQIVPVGRIINRIFFYVKGGSKVAYRRSAGRVDGHKVFILEKK